MLHVLYVYYSPFLECSWFSYGFSCQPLASQYVLADGDVGVDVAVLSWGKEASTVTKHLDGMSVSTRISPSTMSPTLCARIWLSQVYHPIWEGWLMHWTHGGGQTTQQTCLM